MTRILTVALLLCCTISTRAQDTLYFDEVWNPVTKDNHAYFRPLPLKTLGELSLVRDYHKNGNLQMQGYVRSDDPEYYVGDVYWYDEQGMDAGVRQYFNWSKQKKLTYYQPDGGVWLEISYNSRGQKQQVDTYLGGKVVLTGYMDGEKGKLSGSFPSTLYADYRLSMYQRNDRDYSELESISPPKMDSYKVSEIPVVPPAEEEELRPAFNVVTLWQNGKKATEITYGYAYSNYVEKMKQAFWDKEGKAISEIDFQANGYQNPKPYHNITYVTQNSFAVQLVSFVPMLQYVRHGTAIFYYPNGKIHSEEVYNEGELSKATFFHEDGAVDYVSTYRDNQRYDGRFSTSIGIHQFFYHMVDGVMQGKAYLQDSNTGEILDEGEYKDGEPYQGVVYLTDGFGPIHRASYREGKLDGLQTFWTNDWNSDIVETYEAKDGKREGERVIYADGEPGYRSIYHDDTIYSGVIAENNTLSIYENGQLIERKVKTFTHDEAYSVVETFENGLPQLVTYAHFTIAEKPQDSYQGLFRNGKPFDGYFALDALFDDIMLIDYYENGVRKYQYYFEFLDQLANYLHYTYDLKSSFDKQGNIQDGISHRLQDNTSLYITHYQGGKPVSLDINVFAMHYFNRMTIRLEGDTITISDLESPSTMKLHPEEDYITASIFEEGRLVNKRSLPKKVEMGSANSVTEFYLEGDEIKTYTIDSPAIEPTGLDINNRITSQLYFLFPMKSDEPMPVLFEKLLDIVQRDNEEEEWYKEINAYSITPFSDENYLGFLQYDENKEINTAIRPTIRKDKSVLLEGMFNGKLILSKEIASLELLKESKGSVFQEFSKAYYERLFEGTDED